MSTATTARRPFTNRMAIALFLATGILTACVPTAAMAVESTPSATASASASSTAGATAAASAQATASTKSDVVTVGAGGVLIGHTDAMITDPATKQAVGSLAPGDTASWSSLDTSTSPSTYLVSAGMGLQGSVSEMHVFAFPQTGLRLDQTIVVQNAVGKKDPMSGFGGRLDREAMEIRTAPSPESESLATARVDQKLMASRLVKGKDSVMGQSMWAVVLLDAETKSYGFLRAEAISVDANPTAAETLTATEPDQDDEATDEVTAETAEIAEASAPPAAITESKEAPADEAPNTLPLMTGVGGLAVGIVVGAVAARRKRSSEPVGAKGVDKGDGVDGVGLKAEQAPAVTAVEADVESVGAEAPATKITWGD